MDEKKYYWIKLKMDFFNLDEIDFLLSQENGCKYIILYQMLCLNTANNKGFLDTRIGEMIIPYDAEKIARDTKYFDVDTVIVAMELFKKLGLIYEENGGLLKISAIESMVGSESASREAVKKREYRLRKKLEDSKRDTLGTNCPTEYRDKSIDIRDKSIDIRDKSIEKDKDKEKEKEKKKVSKKESFDEMIDNYTCNEELRDELKNHLAVRKAKKGAMTNRAIELSFKKLDELTKSVPINEAEEEKTKIVQQSIENGWVGFFELKKQYKTKKTNDGWDYLNEEFEKARNDLF